jgi:hypothetical protein
MAGIGSPTACPAAATTWWASRPSADEALAALATVELDDDQRAQLAAIAEP